MRLLLMGAFAYPHFQGSQVYFQEQAIALRSGGADVELLTYGSGTKPAQQSAAADHTAAAAEADLAGWRPLDGFVHWKTPGWGSPKSMRAGPNWAKPGADLSLVMTLRDAIASKMSRGLRYDAILTHNAEAALVAQIALGSRHGRRLPILYCAHTLLGNELSFYSKALESKTSLRDPAHAGGFRGVARPALNRVMNRTGATLDRLLARRSDGWIALTHSSHRVMRQSSTAPGALIPPPLPDPRGRADSLDPAQTAARHGLAADPFYLYSGNLDGYQELALLAEAARGRPRDRPRIVVASHDPRVLDPDRFGDSGIEARLVRTAPEMLALIAAARATLVMRRAQGGFPIKLVNSLALGTPPVTFLEREWGLVDGENALGTGRGAPADALRAALDRLDREPEFADRLGRGARALYEANHRPAVVAERTLSLIEQVCRAPVRAAS